jgi:predicted amidophosphoribosyltransferase
LVWGEYDGPLRSALLALKAGHHDELAVPLGRRLAARVAMEPWVDDIDLVTSVPSHPLRRLRVGWPAAACLARVVAAELHKRTRPLLVRHGRDRQTGRSRAERIKLPQRAVTGRGQAVGRRVLVVDDVTTTGTTLRRSAEALLKAGADAVYCAAMAATPDARRVT